MTDEGFHEIQLNGKQLVFLFMAATIAVVVIFLCGVMVGRGVRTQQAVVAAAAVDVDSDPTASAQVPVPPAAPQTVEGAPLSSQETLTYAERLEAPDPPEETLNAEAPPEPAPARAAPAPAPREPRKDPAATVPAAAQEPAGPGFVVQVAAVTERGEADTIAKRLSTKGYPAFVTTPAGVARVFRVRVGKYKERRDAETIATRLEKEEQFKPWITR
jgi:cell division septation protein DedD